VIQRAVPGAESRRVPDRAVKIFPRRLNRVAVGLSEGEIGRNGRRECAPGAVRVRRHNSSPPDLESATVHARDINGIGTLEVPTLDEYDARSGSEDPFTSCSHVVDRSDGHLGEDFSFRDIRRDDVGDLKQLRPQCRNGIDVEQAIAAFCDHDRIDDDLRQIERAHGGHNRFDDRRVCQHADLDGVRTEIADDRSAGIASHETTPRVFCAVTAVIAVVPYTPWAANVFRSAWIPAPPPESLPAMVRAVFMGST
jgi:hypothetical protein